MAEENKNIEKQSIDAQELENVSGGEGRTINTGSSVTAIVRSGPGFGYGQIGSLTNGTYLALRSGTSYSPYNEIAQLYPGYSVFTNGTIVQGTGINGVACYYRYVCFNGIWGYANASFLR